MDVAADAVRRKKLEAAGNVVVELWDTDLWHDPNEVMELVRRGRRDARKRAMG